MKNRLFLTVILAITVGTVGVAANMGRGPNASLRVKFDERRDDVRSILGSAGHYVADASSADVTLAAAQQKCRYFTVDVEGIIKFDYTDDAGNTYTRVMIASPGVNHYLNITKVYRYYVGTTACTAQSYTDAGALIVGICVHF